MESALEAAFSGFGDKEFYPTKEEKGARLGYNLISNHAFVDGNKRIGMYVMLTFLEVNGIHMDCTNDDVAKTGLAVAAGEMSYAALLRVGKGAPYMTKMLDGIEKGNPMFRCRRENSSTVLLVKVGAAYARGNYLFGDM